MELVVLGIAPLTKKSAEVPPVVASDLLKVGGRSDI
jgi:hypothetical protein